MLLNIFLIFNAQILIKKINKVIHLYDQGNSPLLLVCVRGYNTNIETLNDGRKYQIVKLLIERGAQLKQYLKQGINNPLHWSCYFGDLQTTKLLISYEPNLMIFMNDKEQFPIDLILTRKEYENKNNDIQVLEYMITKFLVDYLNNKEHKNKLETLESPCDQTIKTFQETLINSSFQQLQQIGLRKLFWSSILGRADLAIPLIKCNLSPFLPSYKGRNALHAAVYHGRIELVKFFLESDETLQFRQKNYINIMTGIKPQTALHIAIERGFEQIVKYLISKNANPFYYNFRNHRAFEQSRLDEIKKIGRDLFKTNEKNYIRAGYTHVFVGQQRDRNQLLEQQFLNIQEKTSTKHQRKRFKFIRLQSINYHYTYYLIKVDEDLKNLIAQETKMILYNQRDGYLQPFDIINKDSFENFHHIHNQQILMKLIYDEFDLDKFITDGLLIEHFPLHNDDEKQQILAFWKKEQFSILLEPFKFNRSYIKTLGALQTYFGAEIGLFFVFLCFFSTWLFLPTIPGLLIFIYSYFDEYISNIMVPIYTLLMAVWATILFEFWKRKQSETIYNFDMHMALEEKKIRIQFKGTFAIEDVTHVIQLMDKRNSQMKYFKSNAFLVILAIALISIEQVGYYYLTKLQSDSYFFKVLWACILALTVNITNEIFGYFAQKSLNYENHKYEDQRQNAYILKNFTFTFLNSFCRLFYKSIISPDSNEFDLLTVTFTITWSVLHLLRYTILPAIIFSIRKNRFQQEFENHQQDQKRLKQFCKQRVSILDTETSGMNKSHFEKSISSKQFIYQIELNLRMIKPLNLVDQLTYFMTQFCMVTMFSAGSQLVPIIILIFNLINIEGLIYGQVKFTQRPLAQPKKSIGIWNYILYIIGYFGIVINCLTIYQANQQQLNYLIGIDDSKSDSTVGLRNFLFLIIAEHIVIGIKFMIESVIPDQPEWVELVLKKEEFLRHSHQQIEDSSSSSLLYSDNLQKEKRE